MGAILAAVSWRWRIAYLLSGLATAANMYFVLTILYPNNPSIHDWLGLGKSLGSFQVVAIAAVSQAVVLLFALSELRSAATARLGREVAGAGARGDVDATTADEDAGGGGWQRRRTRRPRATRWPGRDAAALDAGDSIVAPAVLAAVPVASLSGTVSRDRPRCRRTRSGTSVRSSGELGLIGWFRNRLHERPVRRDRSRELHGERGGRVDKLDVWMMAVLAVTLLTVRVWRLGEPYQMHFDEVYHPRTAIEFLQDWRYGISQYIYEWTHPHLAKYAMAGGHRRLGQ